MSSNHLKNVVDTAGVTAHNLALESAAAFLERTAADFESAATRHYQEATREPNLGRRTELKVEVHAQNAQARLLRGQANYIREMKLKAD